MIERTFRVPAAWMEPTIIGPYRIEPLVNPACPTKRPTKEWLFYRLSKDGTHISGSRDGAVYAARRAVQRDFLDR